MAVGLWTCVIAAGRNPTMDIYMHVCMYGEIHVVLHVVLVYMALHTMAISADNSVGVSLYNKTLVNLTVMENPSTGASC